MMSPEQAIDAIVDGINRSHRERWQKVRAMSEDIRWRIQRSADLMEIARLRGVNAQMLATLQTITDLCKREPANPFLADNMDRLAITAITKATTGEAP